MAVRNVIEIRGLTKRYGSLTAIENITFEVRRGEKGRFSVSLAPMEPARPRFFVCLRRC